MNQRQMKNETEGMASKEEIDELRHDIDTIIQQSNHIIARLHAPRSPKSPEDLEQLKAVLQLPPTIDGPLTSQRESSGRMQNLPGSLNRDVLERKIQRIEFACRVESPSSRTHAVENGELSTQHLTTVPLPSRWENAATSATATTATDANLTRTETLLGVSLNWILISNISVTFLQQPSLGHHFIYVNLSTQNRKQRTSQQKPLVASGTEMCAKWADTFSFAVDTRAPFTLKGRLKMCRTILKNERLGTQSVIPLNKAWTTPTLCNMQIGVGTISAFIRLTQ
jgi:hypothetical protein